MQANREELAERIARAMREDGTTQLLQGLHLSRSSLPLKPLHSVLEPSLCVIAQGSKEVLLGDSRGKCWPMSQREPLSRLMTDYGVNIPMW